MEVQIMKAKIIFISALVVVGLCGTAWALEGMISHWRFDQGSGNIAYDSVGTNDGTIYGAAWTTGQINGALSFDGMDDYVDVGNDSSLMTTEDLTIFAWIKATKTRACIYSHSWNGWGLGFGIGNNNYDGRLGFYTWTHRHWIEAGGSLADNTWHHVAVTLEGNIVRLYTNGLEVGQGTGTPAANLTGKGLIGLYNYAWHFGGIIDDVIIFNKALSAEEIQQLYLIGVNNPDFVVIQIKNAIFEKIKVIERIDAVMEQEWAAYDALKELLKTGDYGNLKKGDIVTAMQSAHSAIQHQQQSIDALQKSIEKLLYSLSTLGYGPQPPGSNWPPYVTITRSREGAMFPSSHTIEIEADALDFDGSVVMVEFFANGNKIGEDNNGSDGWTTSWADHPKDTYRLTAQATDNEGAIKTSPAVKITVIVLPPPQLTPLPPRP
jgi:hypothetical protein